MINVGEYLGSAQSSSAVVPLNFGYSVVLRKAVVSGLIAPFGELPLSLSSTTAFGRDIFAG